MDESTITKLCSNVAEWMFGRHSNDPLIIQKEDGGNGVFNFNVTHVFIG